MQRIKRLGFTSALFLSLIFGGDTQARLVQILHTNDTHSYLDSATHRPNHGGSARLKKLIDLYKDNGRARGMENLVLDGGDFLEGNIYYMASQGAKSFEVHNSIGYDMVTLGNHDYLMGAEALDKMLGQIDFNFSLLAANVEVGSKFKNIRNKIKPFKEIEIDGIKIALLGLTTNEFYYSWRLEDSKITDPYETAIYYEDLLKKRKNDYIFALTHLGVGKDKKLARKTKHIDLIVGGHSHTALQETVYEQNKLQSDIPIVQAGQHTEYLGRLVVDLEKGRPLKVVSYELIPIKIKEGDSEVQDLVDMASMDLETTYGREWLNEKIGQSQLRSEDHEGSKKWAYFISDALREKVHADVAIHAPTMNGENFPIGDITRKSILNSIPRVYDLEDTHGWSIYTTKIKGFWLKTVFETLALFGQPLAFSGIEMTYVRTPFGLKIGKALINGERINPFKDYTVAFTEGIIRGAVEISPKTKLLLKSPKESPYKVWDTLHEKVIREVIVSRSLNEKNKTYFVPEE